MTPVCVAAGAKGDDAASDRQTWRELQEIKAKTMYQMLEEVSTSHGTKKVVYLTNAQASLFDEDNIDVLLKTFEMTESKLVIILMYTLGGQVRRMRKLGARARTREGEKCARVRVVRVRGARDGT